MNLIRSSTLSASDLLEAAPDAIVLVEPDGRIALVNAQVERLFGYPRQELLGQPVEVLVPDSARAAHPERRRRYLYDPQPRPMGLGLNLSARRRDGTEFPAEISLSAVETPEGPLVAAAIRDVTDRKVAAEAQARLASIVESSDEAIIGKTLDGVITSWNAAAERIFGYTAAEIVGEHMSKLVPPDFQTVEKDLLERIARGERVDRLRTRRRRKGSDVITVSLSLSPVIDALGTIVGAASVSRDLSERELAEAKFQGLLEAAPDAIVGVDGTGRIVMANTQTERLLGYANGELIGQPVEVLVPDEVKGHHQALRDRYILDPRPRPMGHGSQLTARRRDGTVFPAEISLSSLEAEDGLIVLASIRDVTDRLEAAAERERLKAQADRERLEAQLHQAQRLESLGQLAGGVAHDFNNLLAVILNYSAFVEEELRDAIDAGQAERWEPAFRDMGQIQRAAERAIALTHQLLTFGRREVVRPQVIRINDVVREVEALLRRTIGEHVQLSVRLEEDLWSVLADPGQLEQVLVNLAVNSRHAMPGGGTLAIETDNVTLDAAFAARHPGLQPGRFVRLRVGDTGMGMRPEVLAQAFEPFFTTKPKGEGTGLGLATVYGIVTQAGGHVEIYSEPGLGTTVTAFVPATDQAPEVTEPREVRLRPGQGETVLLVEDEEAMREVTRRILERNGYDVVVAADGEHAIALASVRETRINLLLTDVIMPRLLGKEVAEQIRAVRPTLPVLYMSGYARPVLAEQGTLDPDVRLISKPFTEEGMLTAVREILDGA
ncbi:MAG TPA: PAS domain S-box protein [Micromonosporaceae bacterium]|nr:PAS domain S-box protein [Micromonosporaceae bacterium]